LGGGLLDRCRIGNVAITRIKVSNFKSFQELEVDLRPLNIVVGANAAGKSNFLEIFRFLRDLAAHGLENAVSLQGGMGYLTNLRIGSTRPLGLEVTFDFPQHLLVKAEERELWTALVYRSTYSLFLESVGPSAAKILEEEVVHHCEFIAEWMETSERQTKTLGEGEIVLTRVGSEIVPQFLIPNFELSKAHPDLTLSMVLGKGSSSEVLLHKSSFIFPQLSDAIALLDLDPKLSKKARPVTGRADLEQDGSNLSIVLRNILADPERRNMLLRLLGDLLPFADDLKVEALPDKSVLLLLKERFSDQGYLPAPFLSDGTIHLMALILALYFEKAAVTVIEEPERNIHPHLISRIAAMMKDASRQKQIIATTHNPEMVRNADLEDLLLVHRDEDGFSRISRPAESQELKIFLENDLGMDELYVQNLLA
jgi:predicted ATPase